jgi:transcriptional regulator with XRE-family HTH domain
MKKVDKINQIWFTTNNMDLKTYIKISGKSREQFAREVGTTKNYINNLCQKNHFPSRKLAQKIEKISKGKVKKEHLLFPKDNETVCSVNQNNQQKS